MAHYIYKLSIERLHSGKDNYSVEAYNTYLKEGGIDSQKVEQKFKQGIKYLRKAQRTVFPINLIYRLIAFGLSKQLRDNYRNKAIKKELMKRNLTL